MFLFTFLSLTGSSPDPCLDYRVCPLPTILAQASCTVDEMCSTSDSMSASRDNRTDVDGFLSQLTYDPTSVCPSVILESQGAALDLSSAITEVTNTRHRCYIAAFTLRLPPDHFHLRIAGVVPARNEMLDITHPVDPAGYEVLQAPQALRLASAQLRDGTLVRPLLTEFGKIYLTLSGILLAGDVSSRYIVYRHLVDLGLAGPTAPALQWSSRVRPPIADRGILPFWALTDLPAELLAAPFPTMSWAFDSAPTMTLLDWEKYRQRHTCRVVMSNLLVTTHEPPGPSAP